MKTTVYPSSLAARCAAQNAVNAEANRLSAATIEALRPYVGRKVIKTTDRRFVASVAAILPPAAPDVQKWLAHSDWGLCFSLKTHRCASGRQNALGVGDDYQIAHYAEAYFYAGEVDASGTLLKVSDPVNYRTDYTPDAIAAARKAAELAREAARQAESACDPFGLYDR